MSKEKAVAPKNYVVGKYAVGTSCFSIVDIGRKEVLGDGEGDRKISVRMYYPAAKEDVEGRKRATIFSDAKKTAIMKAYHIRKVSDEMNYADYYENVPVAQGTKFPLIMFSMGYNSYVESNTYLLCALASSGYIVASVGHAYEAVENDYEDGSYDLYDKKINKRMYNGKWKKAHKNLLKKGFPRNEDEYVAALTEFEAFQNEYTPYIMDRVKEWEADILKALGEVKIRYSEHLDLSRGVGASGHSLGGCLAYFLCRYNDEFSCGINMDGGLFGNYPEKIMEKPFCQISCKENVNVETRPLVQTKADTYLVIFEDMKHMGFTDAKFYIPIKMLSGKLDSEEMFRHLMYCHIRFFDQYLKGKDVTFKGMTSDKVHYKMINR